MRVMWMGVAACALAAPSALVGQPTVDIRTSDVERFYRIYDAADGRLSAEALQRGYLDKGTDGVRQFIPDRIQSADALAHEIAASRAVYDRARTCMKILPAVKAKLRDAFRRLAALDPAATFPPVTILIGRGNSGGTTGKSGVLIGLEVACQPSLAAPNLADRLYRLVAHEYGHVEQSAALDDNSRTTVLRQSLIEGVAELVADLITGEVSNAHLKRWTAGRMLEIDRRFLADADSSDLSAWLYNGVGTPERPGDLGYWVGYRIAKAYYREARDKRAALRTLFDLDDPRAVLVDSGWRPGS